MHGPEPESISETSSPASVAASGRHDVRLEGIVERLGPDEFRFTASDGSVSWKRLGTIGAYQYTATDETMQNRLRDGATDRVLTLEDERRIREWLPLQTQEHGRPYAYESLSQLFDDPKVPDTLAIPAPGFPFHGNAGNHGALTSVQSRGICIAAGPGFTAHGWIADHGRTIDVSPTVLAALHGSTQARLHNQDGAMIDSLVNNDGPRAKHAVVVVFDGCNINLIDDVVECGDAPAIASLLARGTGLRHGIVSSFPTVTLPNHTAAFTAKHPGHSGVVHNEFLDLDGKHVNLLELESMIRTCDWLTEGTETLHEAIHRLDADAFTTSIFEYIDRGADWSNYSVLRDGETTRFPKEAHVASTASSIGWDHEVEDAKQAYRFMTRLDEYVVATAVAQWAADSEHPLPTLQVVNLNLTDSAGHAVGPHFPMARAAIIDSDRRLQRLLNAIDDAGVLAETAIMLISDHGMEQCDMSLVDHPSADLTEVWAQHGRREVGDIFLYPI
jgi:hypothetical protein